MEKIYGKLIKARAMFVTKNIKPTGKNQGRFNYFELEDILPPITQICNEVGLLPVMNYYQDRAVLTIYDTESEGTITLESPMSTAKLSGCHEVQNLGAVQTYLKRYLYMHAFDVAEADVLDGTLEIDDKPKKKAPAPKPQPAPQAPAAPAKPKATPEQTKEMTELAKNFTQEELAALKADYGHDITMLIDKMREYSQDKTQEKAHPWASPEVRQKLGETAETFQDDSNVLI